MDYIQHHGILGQKWGKRNGPPYPLSGGDYSPQEKEKIYKARHRGNSIYNKKHFDKVISKNTKLTTLSYDKNRTKDTDMFYAAYDKADKHLYNALFNRKIPQDITDENGNNIGTGMFYKWRINNVASTAIKVASEDSSAKIFKDLYSKSRDFYNYVTDPGRMESLFVKDKYKFKGYREAKKALEKIRSGKVPSEEELQIVYRMFNYCIPSDGSGNARKAKDVLTQRAKFFTEMKKAGYGAVLDTNDAIYGGFKAHAPVIVFDMGSIVAGDISRTTFKDVRFSRSVTIGRKMVGI